MPPAFQRSSNYHLGIHPLHPPMRLLAALRAAAHSNGGRHATVASVSVPVYDQCRTHCCACMYCLMVLVNMCCLLTLYRLDEHSFLCHPSPAGVLSVEPYTAAEEPATPQQVRISGNTTLAQWQSPRMAGPPP